LNFDATDRQHQFPFSAGQVVTRNDGKEYKIQAVDRQHNTMRLVGYDGTTLSVDAFSPGVREVSAEIEREFATGDRVVFERNDRELGIKNGQSAQVRGWQGDRLQVVIGDRENVGEALLHDPRIPLVSATGSVRMGRHVGEVVSRRLGKTILELGGNNGIVVTPSADLKLAVPAIVFGAVGTAGQRCTSTRRIIVHESIKENLVDRLVKAYRQVKVGDPLKEDTLMGPLIDPEAVSTMHRALETVKSQGGVIRYGGELLSGGIYDAGTYVTPCICEATPNMAIVKEETFAPILYIIPYEDLEEAVAIHNAVPQGLSSAIFTTDLREYEHFLSCMGSDCGIANVNIGTSGAEIGGAFGGEKETGGGRESGSDAWKAYMRRQTCTINWSRELPLAQGIRFDLD
ncbi:MAG: aldehyde dehydrogenase family protein, partial [Thermodesulfobacteriota bacterium]